MAELFAAIDAAGEVRFVAEVPRGSTCGCRCPECFSPLVAKQGTTRAWHFAHEGGQERPECEVGAANLLRRLAIGVLRSQQVVIPNFRQRFGGRTVELDSECATPWEWNETPVQRAWAARSSLRDGSPLELHVEVSQPPAVADSSDVAVVSFVLAFPALEELQSRAAAENYIRTAGSMLWRHRPDPEGLLEKAAAQYRDEVAAESAAEREHQQADSSTRMAAAARRRDDAVAARSAEDEAHRAVSAAKVLQYDAATASLLRCVPGRATNSSLILYHLRNGTCWLFYSLGDGGGALVQWPLDHSKELEPPQDVAALDPNLGVYRTTSMKATMFMNPRSVAVRTDSDPRAIARWVTDNFTDAEAARA